MKDNSLFKNSLMLAGILRFSKIPKEEVFNREERNKIEEALVNRIEHDKSIKIDNDHYKSLAKEMANKLKYRLLNFKEIDPEQKMIKLDMSQRIKFDYINWKGEFSTKTVEIGHVWHGSTEWHPEPQFLLRGFDLEKRKIRDFAMADMFNVVGVK